MCHNLAFRRDFSPVLAKHSKHFSLEDTLSIGVDRMQRNFEPMRQQVESWRTKQNAIYVSTCCEPTAATNCGPSARPVDKRG